METAGDTLFKLITSHSKVLCSIPIVSDDPGLKQWVLGWIGGSPLPGTTRQEQ